MRAVFRVSGGMAWIASAMVYAVRSTWGRLTRGQSLRRLAAALVITLAVGGLALTVVAQRHRPGKPARFSTEWVAGVAAHEEALRRTGLIDYATYDRGFAYVHLDRWLALSREQKEIAARVMATMAEVEGATKGIVIIESEYGYPIATYSDQGFRLRKLLPFP